MVSSGMRLRIEIISYSLLIREIQVQRYTIFTELRKKVCILEIIRIFAIGFGHDPSQKYRSVILLLVTTEQKVYILISSKTQICKN